MPLKFNEANQAKEIAAASQKEVFHAQNDLVQLCCQLHRVRSEVAKSVVSDFESFINTLSSSPKEYDRTFDSYRYEAKGFDDAGRGVYEHFVESVPKTAVVSGAAAGTVAGAATAFGAPTAAMAIATTFGTASSGAAISSLSGVAATNAAAAWLGGGALAAGGGGMAAGNALLALAGPIGLGIAGVSVAVSVGMAALKNRSTIEEAVKEHQINQDTLSEVKVTTLQVSKLYELTNQHVLSLRTKLKEFASDSPKSHDQLSEQQKGQLEVMHKDVLTLGRLLKVKPAYVASFSAPA